MGTMRPEILHPLFAGHTSLPGIGPRFAKMLETATGGARVVDLLWHLPNGIIDRRASPPISAVEPGTLVTITVRVEGHVPGRNRRQP